MPCFYHHPDGYQGSYVLTTINGRVAVYALTKRGHIQMVTVSLRLGPRFPRALLLQLHLTGGAHTHTHEVADPSIEDADPLTLDLVDDPDTAAIFPVCELCQGVEDLHYTLSGTPRDLVAQLKCGICRATRHIVDDTSLPLAMLNVTTLDQLFKLKRVTFKAPNAKRFEALLRQASGGASY